MFLDKFVIITNFVVVSNVGIKRIAYTRQGSGIPRKIKKKKKKKKKKKRTIIKDQETFYGRRTALNTSCIEIKSNWWMRIFMYSVVFVINDPYFQNMRKSTFGHVRPAKVQTRLRVRGARPESFLGAFMITKDSKFLHAENDD